MYRHTQIGWGIILVFSILLILEVLGIIGGIGFSPSDAATIGFVIIVLGISFSTLTITVDDQRLQLKYGIFGFPRKTVRLSEVDSCRAVKSLWIAFSLGIHYGLGGWLYNVSGPHAVLLSYKNGKRIYIGTDEPEKLVDAINSNIQSKA